MSMIIGRSCCLSQSRVCKRISCKPEPWIYEGEIVRCEGCGKEMCRYEAWELEEINGKEIMLCSGCIDRLLELEGSP